MLTAREKAAPWGALSSTNDPPFTAKTLQSRWWTDFNWFFDDPKRHQKINDFSNHQKWSKRVESIDPGAPKISFWTKNDNLRHPFLHCFFAIFRKWQKCKISEEYNAKRGSEPSKTFDFRIDFSCNFHVFSEPHPRGHFSRVKVPVYNQKYDFGAIHDFPGGRKWTHKPK